MKKFDENSNLHLIDPIPVWKRMITNEELGCSVKEFNDKLIQIAKKYYEEWLLEVPDEKHIDKSTIPQHYFEEMNNREAFEQVSYPAIGKWHGVKTNNFLDVLDKEVQLLKKIILGDYQKCLTEYFNFEFNGVQNFNHNHRMDESWLQFYKNGDYKVKHNHLRYSHTETEHKNMWAGGYYLSDGEPDITQPYTGRFCFNTRNKNYIVKPEEGMILLFPADVVHEVFPFYGKSERICLNFNLSTRA